MIEKWDWYGQTACLAAAAAQEAPEDQDRVLDHHRYQTLTENPQKYNKQEATTTKEEAINNQNSRNLHQR